MKKIAVATLALATGLLFLRAPEKQPPPAPAPAPVSPPVLASPAPATFSELPTEILADLETERGLPDYHFDGSTAWNHPGGFSARYAANHGMRVRHPADGWDVRMKLSSACEDSEPVAEGDTLYLDHPGGLTERWANGPAGVEHAVLVAGPGALERATFALHTGLEPAVSPGGQGVEFRDVGGETVFEYSGFRAIDADGKTLPSEIALTSTGEHTWQLALLAEDAGARYPLTLDPLMSTKRGRLVVPFAERTEGDLMGYSIAASGERIAVGVPRLAPGGTGGTVLVYVYSRGDNIWRREATVAAPDPVGGESFGVAVDLWGTTLVVGALERARVFRLAPGGAGWELFATLLPVSEADEVTVLGGFGTRVAAAGELVFVGAPNATVQTLFGAGAVQVFRLPAAAGGAAEVVRTLHAPSPGALGAFGSSVSAGDGRLAVGAPRMTPSAGAADAGTAFVYSFDPENFGGVTVREVSTPADESGARFGAAVSLDGGTLAVGSPDRTWLGTSDAGTVDVFRFDPATGNWPWEDTLAAHDGNEDAGFGTSVALSGDTLVAGAPEGKFNGADQGTAYIYERYQNGASPSGDAWGFAEKVRGTGTNFGFSAAASGDLYVLGAPTSDFGEPMAGLVVPYVRRSTRWRESPLNLDAGGAVVALDGGLLATGEPDFGDAGGRVRIARRNDGPLSTDVWRSNGSDVIAPPTPQAGQEFGAAVALKDPWLAVGAPGWNSIDATGGGRCYLFFRSESDWIHVATYELPVPETGDRFGAALSITERWLAIGSDGANRVRLYDRLLPDAGFAWGFTQEFEGNASFGSAVALHPAGQLLAVGTPGFGGGSTRIFEIDPTRAAEPWVFQTNISPGLALTPTGTGSGSALAFRGDLLAIGEPFWPGGGRVALREWNRGEAGAEDPWGIRHTLTVPDAPDDAALGTSVAMSGRFVVAGAPGYASPHAPGSATGAAFVFDPRRDTSGPGTSDVTPHHTLIPARAASGFRTGTSVAADGSEIAVGAPGGGIGPLGTTSVFARQWWAWTPSPLGSFGDAGFQTGYSVDIEGDYLAFSVPFDDIDDKPGAGSVRLYKRNRSGFGGWGNVRTFFSPAPTTSGQFGLSLGFSGNALLIGAPGEDGGEGTAYLFERNQDGPDQWGMSRKFAPPGLQNGDDFGQACGIDADTIAIGAPGKTINTGALYFFGQRLGAAKPWVFHQETGPPIPATQTFFGCSIAVQGHRVLAGATLSDFNVPGSGSAHIYGRTGEDTWGLARTLLPIIQQTGSLFGFSVALDGPLALVGAPRHDHPNGIESGNAILFDRDLGGPGAWRVAATLYPAAGENTPTAEDRFGWGVAVTSRRAVVSAPQTTVGSTSRAGALHVFERNATTANGWDRSSLLTATGSQTNDQLGRALAAGPSTIIAGVPLHDRTSPILEPDRGRVLLFEETGSAFSQWLAAHGLPANADPLADPDQDGLPTIHEAYLDSDPTSPGPGGGFAARVSLQGGRAVLQWHQGKETNGTTARIATSPDLTTWTHALPISEGISSSPPSLLRTIGETSRHLVQEYRGSPGTGPRLFFRIEVTLP